MVGWALQLPQGTPCIVVLSEHPINEPSGLSWHDFLEEYIYIYIRHFIHSKSKSTTGDSGKPSSTKWQHRLKPDCLSTARFVSALSPIKTLLCSSSLQYVAAKSSERLKIYNPTDDSLVTDDVHVAGQEDVDAAVAAARAAFPAWAATPAGERAAILYKFADLIEANTEAIGALNTMCSGQIKLMTSRFEPKLGARYLRCKSTQQLHMLSYLGNTQIMQAGVTSFSEK